MMKRALLVLLLLIGFRAQGASLDDAGDVFRPGRIEILISANTFSSIESFFGHSSILVIPEGGSWEDGRVFDFLAATDESNILKYYAKGLSGQFPFTLAVAPVRDFLFKRLFIEQRSVQRLILPTSPEQRQKLWDHLLDLQKNPKKIGDYYFVRYNCATAVLAALKYSGIQINTKQIILEKPVRGVRPTVLSSWLRAGLLTPFPEQSVPSVLAMVESLENRYRQTLRSQPTNKDKTRFADWPASTLALLPKLSTEELLVIANILLPADQNRAGVIQQILRTRPSGPSRMIHFRELPQAFYDVCENSACAQNVVAELKKVSSEKGLQRMALGNEMQFADSWLSFMPEINFETSPQVRHWKLLNEALSPYR
jgi:hypothetical protein